MTGDRLVLTIENIDAVMVRDDLTGRDVPAPIGLAEVSSDAWQASALPSTVDTGCRTDVVTLDGSPIPVRIRASVADVLDGRAIPVSLCETRELTLSPGRHILASADGTQSVWTLETAVLRSVERSDHGVASPVSVTSGRGQRNVTGIDCAGSCWLELPDGWNDGWTGSDTAESRPSASASGRNLWLVDGDLEALDVSWSPQRIMWVGLAVTLASLVALLAWAGLGRPVAPIAGRPRRPPSRVAVTVTTFVLGALTIDPLWGFGLAVLMAVIGRRPRTVAGAGVFLVSLAMVFVVAQQIRTGVQPGFAWPDAFARAHRPALAGLVLLWTGVWAMDREPPLGSRS